MSAEVRTRMSIGGNDFGRVGSQKSLRACIDVPESVIGISLILTGP